MSHKSQRRDVGLQNQKRKVRSLGGSFDVEEDPRYKDWRKAYEADKRRGFWKHK